MDKVVGSTLSELISTVNVTKEFKRRTGILGGISSVVAVREVTIRVHLGRTLGIIGESGSGKSTLARLLCGLLPSSSGEIYFKGRNVTKRYPEDVRKSVQMVFQDPFGSLDPTKTIGYTIGEPLRVRRGGSGRSILPIVEELATRVALNPDLLRRYPDQLSGGQRQRVSIARALALEPEVIVADEPTSALDLSTRSEILNLFLGLQVERNLSMVLVSHDFSTIRHLSHDIVVMFQGAVVEEGPAKELVSYPKHPYTAALLSAVPEVDASKGLKRSRIRLGPDSGGAASSGCAFAPRCPIAREYCFQVRPVPDPNETHWATCHFSNEVPALLGMDE